jgi:hypothetical protein
MTAAQHKLGTTSFAVTLVLDIFHGDRYDLWALIISTKPQPASTKIFSFHQCHPDGVVATLIQWGW